MTDRRTLIIAIMRERESQQGQPVHPRVKNKRGKRKPEAGEEAWDIDKATWIEAHGSDRLKMAHSADYPHHRAYIQERARVELGKGWTVDTKNVYEWDRKAYPSKQALDLERMVRDKGFKAQIVWVKSDGKERDYDEAFEPFEAVVVRDFLGRYDAIHEM
jgi:hypothetical protein